VDRHLPLLGEQRRLEVVCDAKRRRTSFTDGSDYVRVFVARRRQVRAVLVRWYQREARDYYAWQVRRMARQLGVSAGRVVVSSARSQWGSCIKETGRISLQWRLLLGPRDVVDYVIAHEVAHLLEDNHSAEYWQLVGRLVPQHKSRRRWLRINGDKLKL